MGFFRGSFLFTVSVLLFISILVMNSTLTLSKSLEYENVQQQIGPIAKELTDDRNTLFGRFSFGEVNLSDFTDKAQESLREHCENNTDYSYNLNKISIPCSFFGESKEAVVNKAVSDILQEYYYKQYDCGFWSCLTREQIPLFLVSKHAKDYWHQKFYFSLIAAIILIALMFLLVEKKLNWPILAGSIIILASLPLLKIKSIFEFFIPDRFKTASILLDLFFSKSYGVFWISFLIGLVILGAGLGLKFSNLEFVKKWADKVDKKDTDKKSTKKEK